MVQEFSSPKKASRRGLLLFCHSKNEHNGSLEITLLVAPIDRPDDGLNNLSANIKVHIGYTQLLDEEFFKKCEAKIIHLIEAGVLTSFVEASKKELSNPSETNRKYEVPL